MNSNNKKTILIAAATLLAGILIGWLLFGGHSGHSGDGHDHAAVAPAGSSWTCSMHPQIRQNEPGDCPLCGMDLIPVEEEGEETEPMAIRMSATAMQLAGVQTAVVESSDPVKTLRLSGKVEADERLRFTQAAHIPGRIEQLVVNFSGEYVERGQPVAYIYSPELVTAQQELFEAYKIKDSRPQLFDAAREKLKSWKLDEDQIKAILDRGTVQEKFAVHADAAGYVLEKMVKAGDYVRAGQTFYRMADLSRVWVMFDVYESDLPWIKKGDALMFTVAGLPGESFQGSVTYIDPIIDPDMRVAKARVEVDNPRQRLKPEMFTSGEVTTRLAGAHKRLTVPKSAVMWTGTRSLVYVKNITEAGLYFMMREVTLGPALGNRYVVIDGLQAGEEIAIHGTFSIDAAAQLAGKPSMMNPAGGVTMTGHDHGGQGAMQETPKTPAPEKVFIPGKAQEALQPLFTTYFDLKNHLVNDDFEQAVASGKAMRAALGKIDMALFSGAARNIWMDNQTKISGGLEHVHHFRTIEELRKAFQGISNAMIATAEAFGAINGAMYVQYCPMADDYRGANWLSAEKEIKNPYFGASMLKCGEVTKTIE